jgi:hypothetical protein
MSSILNALPLARLRFDLEVQADNAVHPYKGDMLRMALLWWLSEYWCPMPTRCRHGCEHPDICMFGRICTPAVNPAWPSKLRYLMGDAAPPAYVLWDLRDRRTHLRAGDRFGFELVLVGDLALSQLPAVVAAVQQGAEAGMGRQRMRARLRAVYAQTLAAPPQTQQDAQSGDTADQGGWVRLPLAVEKDVDGEAVLTWQSYRLTDIVLTYATAQAWAEAHSTRTATLRMDYCSPMKIKERGSWVREPTFSAVARAVVRRLRLLSVAHGGGVWPHDVWGPLLDLAETVQLDHHETQWTAYTRRSKQSGQYEIEGFLGPAWYSSREDLRPLLPVLWLGQWLHLGKGYVLGNGRYRVQPL